MYMGMRSDYTNHFNKDILSYVSNVCEHEKCSLVVFQIFHPQVVKNHNLFVIKSRYTHIPGYLEI